MPAYEICALLFDVFEVSLKSCSHCRRRETHSDDAGGFQQGTFLGGESVDLALKHIAQAAWYTLLDFRDAKIGSPCPIFLLQNTLDSPIFDHMTQKQWITFGALVKRFRHH